MHEFAMNKNEPVDEGSDFLPNIGEIGYGRYGQEVPTKTTIGVGVQEREVDSSECFCKVITHDEEGRHTCYVRCEHGKRLFNPYSAMSSASRRTGEYEVRTGKPLSEYVAVPDHIFKMYFKYLETQNAVHFRQCERELYDA